MATISQIKIGNVNYDIKAQYDGNGNTISSYYLPLSGGYMTGNIQMQGGDLLLATPSSSSNDSGDIVWQYGNGQEKMRIWSTNEYTSKTAPNFREYNSSGNELYSGNLVLGDGTGATGHWDISSNYVNLFGLTRQASANLAIRGYPGLTHFLATTTMTTAKPMADGHIIHMYWDNTGGYDSQLFIKNGNAPQAQLRGMSGGIWGNWTKIYSENNLSFSLSGTTLTITKS